jgi:hypothetical protein
MIMSEIDRQPSSSSGIFSFDFDEVMQHLRLHHPGCPKEARQMIAGRVSAREWKGLQVGGAVGIELQNFIRHQLTEYDELRRSKVMTRDEARAFVASDVQKVLRAWRAPQLRLRAARPEWEGLDSGQVVHHGAGENGR